MLSFQLIYKGKTQRSLSTVHFPDGFYLLYNEKHWSDEETACLIEQVFVPYSKQFKEKGLPNDQKVSLYRTHLKLNLQPMYLMFYQSTELNLL